MKKDFLTRYKNLKNLKDDSDAALKRQRGLDFEELINDMMIEEGISLRKGYHTDDNRSEQIDGAVEIYNRVFLLEVKWVEGNLAASSLYSFIGKIENKFHGTLGIFISHKKLEENFINALNKGRRQSVIVIHGEDIEELFKDNFSFQKYIEFAYKTLSYDNIVHYPISEFLKVTEQSKALASTETQSASTRFISKTIFGSKINQTDLLLAIKDEKKDTLDEVYSFILETYPKAWLEYFNSSKSQKLDNYNQFLKTFSPSEETLTKTAEKYYGEWLKNNFNIYSREQFARVFCAYYANLSPEKITAFETFIIEKAKKARDNYDDENSLTEVIRPIWDDLKATTKEALSDFYLEIFNSSRLDKYPQKKFANELVTSKQISEAVMRQWLETKLSNAKNSYKKIGDETVYSVTKAYLPLGKMLYGDITAFMAHVQKQLKENQV